VGIDKSENLWLISTPSPFIPLPLAGEGGSKEKEGLAPLFAGYSPYIHYLNLHSEKLYHTGTWITLKNDFYKLK